MRSDFEAIVHNLDGRTIRVWAVGDVHIGARESDIQGFKKFLDEKVLNDPDSYIVLVGDLVNNGIRSANCPTNIYEETMPPSAQVEKAVELLSPVKDKILGSVGGNHELRSKKQTDWDIGYNIMLLLGKGELYRPNMAFLRIILGKGNTKSRYALLLVHGKTANKARQFAYSVEGVSAIVHAHTHSGLVERPARLVLSAHNVVSVKPLVSLTACSWQSYGGYAMQSLLQPKATSIPQCLELEYTATNDREGSIRVVW